MDADESSSRPSTGSGTQRATDRLALALEEIGFDVGVAFPELQAGSDRSGRSAVCLGSVAPAVASELSTILSDAARLGVTHPPR